jgi:granule-bound starch synthase
MIFIFYKKLKYVSLPQVNIGDTVETVRFFHCHKRGVDRVFVDHPMFLEKVC